MCISVTFVRSAAVGYTDATIFTTECLWNKITPEDENNASRTPTPTLPRKRWREQYSVYNGLLLEQTLRKARDFYHRGTEQDREKQ